jgi:hypothetical protein
MWLDSHCHDAAFDAAWRAVEEQTIQSGTKP